MAGVGILAICYFLMIAVEDNEPNDVPYPAPAKPSQSKQAHKTDPTYEFGDVPFSIGQNALQPTEFLGDLKAPYPTHSFWFNMVLEEGAGPGILTPLAAKCLTEGVMFSYPAARRKVTTTTVSDYFQNDLGFGAAETYEGHKVVAYDSLSVKFEYQYATGGQLTTHLVRGTPYGTVVYDGLTPVIHHQWSNITAVNGAPAAGTTVSGSDFLIEGADGMRWKLFTESDIELEVSENGLAMTATAPYSGVMRAAYSPTADFDAVLETYKGAYPVGGLWDYEVAGDYVTYTYNWTYEGTGPLLMGAIKHQSDILANDTNFVQKAAYSSMKGPVDLIEGDFWTLSEKLPTITWTAPRNITDHHKIRQIQEQLAIDVAIKPPNDANPYFAGKVFARMARIALIAEEYNATNVQFEAIGVIEQYMDKWLQDDNGDSLVFETNWGGVVTALGLNSWSNDFGNGFYNDHHFHYGYFLYTLAVVIKMDPAYYTTNQKAIDFIMGDIATKEFDSPFFPHARHKDFYDFHSWAKGLFMAWDGKSQESSSEAVNAYYGLFLLGLALQEAGHEPEGITADWGRVLLAMELRGAHYYWQVHSDNGDIYDQYFAANKMVGQLGGTDAFCQTWFGDELQFIHGINLLPFTPITEELLPYSYILEEWPVLKTALNNSDLTPAWAGVMYLDYAIVDPEDAWGLMTALDDNSLDDGFSMANAMYWIATRPDMGPYNNNATRAPQVVQPQCIINQGCANAGFTEGDCCPGTNGTYAECCPTVQTGAAKGASHNTNTATRRLVEVHY